MRPAPTKYNAAIVPLRLLYMEALTEMKGESPVYPDANLTLRFSYGNIKGYQAREAEYRTPFTTLKGMIEKDTGEKPFDAPQKLKDLQAAHDFGRYGEGDTVGAQFPVDDRHHRRQQRLADPQRQTANRSASASTATSKASATISTTTPT